MEDLAWAEPAAAVPDILLPLTAWLAVLEVFLLAAAEEAALVTTASPQALAVLAVPARSTSSPTANS